MATTQQSNAQKNTEQHIGQLEHFVTIGLALARQSDQTQLLEQILQSAQHISKTEGGTIYRCDGQQLEFATLINHRLGLHQGGTSGQSPQQAAIPLLINGKPNDSAVVAMAAMVITNKQLVAIWKTCLKHCRGCWHKPLMKNRLIPAAIVDGFRH